MQYRMRSERGVTHECRFPSRRKETDAQIVARIIRRQDECGVAIAQLPGQGLHLGIAQLFRIQHDTRGVSRKAHGGESVDLEQANTARHCFRARGLTCYWNPGR